MSTKSRWLIGCSLPLVTLVALGFVVANKFKPKPEAIRVETVSKGTVEVKVVETGTIEPLRKVEVKSKVGGRVLKLFVKEGDFVRQGQKLATIDPQEINSQVAALRAQLTGSQARLSAARKSTSYQQSQTSAGISQNRQAVNSALSRLRSAEAEAKVQPVLTNQSIAISQANLEAAQSNLKLQEDNLRLLMENTHPQTLVNVQSAYDRALAQTENTRRTIARQKALLEKGFVSQQVVDTAQTDLLVAEAQVREARQRLDRIKATNELEVTNARSQIASARSQVRQQEATLLQAQTSVLPETKRRELENARAAYAQARAQLRGADAGITQDAMRGDEAVASLAGVEQLQKQLDELLVRQNDTTIIASMDGVITKKYTEEGELITSAIGSFSSGSPLYQISDLSTMLVKINVNEVDIQKMKVGTITEVTVDSSRGTIFMGKVSKVAPAASNATASSGSAATTSSQTVIRFPVEIQVDKSDPRLKPGMSARCAVIVNREKDVVRVPKNCVKGEGKTGTADIVTPTVKPTKDGATETVTVRTVEVGLRGDDFVEVKSGLKEGEKVRPAAFNGPKRQTIEMNNGPN